MNTHEEFKIGELIRNYRMKNNLTQEKLAELIGVSSGSIGQIERDETYPKLDNLAKLVDILNIDGNAVFYYNKRYHNENELLKNEILLCLDKLDHTEKDVILCMMKKLISLHQIKDAEQQPEK